LWLAISGGAHAEHWNMRDYLDAGPLIFFRRILNSAQDFRSAINQMMRDSLLAAFRPIPPLIYASGHDHGLQVLKGDLPPNGPRRYLVSGAGAYEHLDPTRKIDRTLFEDRASGYMRLDFLRGGGVRLAVHEVDGKGNIKEVYSETVP
jgi:hypothetical protein